MEYFNLNKPVKNRISTVCQNGQLLVKNRPLAVSYTPRAVQEWSAVDLEGGLLAK